MRRSLDRVDAGPSCLGIAASRKIAVGLLVIFLVAHYSAQGANTYPPGFQGFMPLPENKHYFQYRGLPFFAVKGGNPWGGVPMNCNAMAPGNDTRFFCDEVARGDGASQTALQAVQSESQYASMQKEAKRALAEDRMYAITFFHKNWCLGTTSDELIKRAVKYTWGLPNVTYSFIYEGDTRGSWIRRFKELGKQEDPNFPHMFFSVQDGSPVSEVDFLLAEGHESGIQWGSPKDISASYLSSHPYPLVRDAVVQCLCFKDRKCLSVGESGCQAASASGETAKTMRKQVLQGVNSGTPYGKDGTDGSYENYTVQIRWYVENMRTFENEPGDELVDSRLPRYVDSKRPSLNSATGYTHGAKTTTGGVEFAVVYSDPDGDAPALKEVWVDMNADGRFCPDPSKGERVVMKGSGTDYESGVTYTAGPIVPTYKGTQSPAYVFRFADKNWYPPLAGGATPPVSSAASYSKAPAYSYGHWSLDGVTGNGGGTAVRSHLRGHGALRGVLTGSDLSTALGASACIHGVAADGRRIPLSTDNAAGLSALLRSTTAPPGVYVLQIRHGGTLTSRRIAVMR